MINLTILGIAFLVLGLTIFALTVLSAARHSNGNDNRFKDSIANLCMGAVVGVLLFTSMLCFNVQNTLKKESPQCMERADSTMVIKPEKF
jgi:NO-binding membrane sensor protein with MHYT domain